MADNSGSGGGGAGMGLIVGALVVVVAIIGFFVYQGGSFGSSKTFNVNVKAPSVSAPAAPSTQ